MNAEFPFDGAARRVLVRAWRAWGPESQFEMLVEECGELVVAVCHWRRRRDELADTSPVEDLVDELADVSIMIEQVLVGTDLRRPVEIRIREKLQRLWTRLGPHLGDEPAFEP